MQQHEQQAPQRAVVRLRSIAAILIPLAVLASAVAVAQPPEQLLLEGPPYDEIHLRSEHRLQVEPLKLTPRVVPSPLPTSGELRFRLLDRPDVQLEVDWKRVSEIKLFEDLLFQEASALAEQGRFGQAFENLKYLQARRPDHPGLTAAVSDLLLKQAVGHYRREEFEMALVTLAALQDRNPEQPGLARAITRTLDKRLEQLAESKDLARLKGQLTIAEEDFGEVVSPVLKKWQQTFVEEAEAQLRAAEQAVEEGDIDRAWELIFRAGRTLPESSRVNSLARKLHERSPRVVVGVLRPSAADKGRFLDDHAARRYRSMLRVELMRVVRVDVDGAEYASPLGEWTHDAGQLRSLLVLSPQARERTTAGELVRTLLARIQTEPSLQPLAARLASVHAPDEETLQFRWTGPHVRPAALLGADVSEALTTPLAPFLPQPSANDAQSDLRWVRSGSATRQNLRQPIEIRERVFSDPQAAELALVQGSIHVLDRVTPWQKERLASRVGIRFSEYAVPSVHVLLPGRDGMFASEKIRRGLIYALDREGILQDALLSRKVQPGCRVVSGPFTSGRDLGDALAYATDATVRPRAYQPRLGLMLIDVELKRQLQEQGQKADEVEKIELADYPLVLAHRSEPLAALACREIAQQWRSIGLQVELLPLEELPSESRKSSATAKQPPYDFLYAELHLPEPLVDARRLFGSSGLTGDPSIVMGYNLLQVDEATNWPELNEAMRRTHRIARQEVRCVPLWQTLHYVAFRSELDGLTPRRVSLYDDVEAWTIAPPNFKRRGSTLGETRP